MNTPTYEDSKVDLTINQIDRDTFDNLSAIEPNQLYFITSADTVVVDCDMTAQFEQWSEEMDYILGLSAVQELSAVEQMVDGKRDYSDLTFGESDSLVLSSDFDLSGLGCSTLNLSGTYEDETTFSYDFVVKEANQ